MTYPTDVLFDIETLINVAQAEKILFLGNHEPTFLDNYREQKLMLNQDCTIVHLRSSEIDHLWLQEQRFDVAIALDLFEHIEKTKGMQVLSRLRDVLCSQYCVCLPLSTKASSTRWQLTELFSFALSKVSSYQNSETTYGLFKYNINDYKKTPDWLNSDNWANPHMWGKYRW